MPIIRLPSGELRDEIRMPLPYKVFLTKREVLMENCLNIRMVKNGFVVTVSRSKLNAEGKVIIGEGEYVFSGIRELNAFITRFYK